MVKTVLNAAAALGLALVPVATHAEDEGDVSYETAMKCGALFSYISALEEEDEEAQMEMLDLSTRWLVVAMVRDGTEDGSVAEAEFEPLVDELIAEVDAMDDAGTEEFLLEGISYCEGQHELIAEEMESIELE